jgi:hypothetical protein
MGLVRELFATLSLTYGLISFFYCQNQLALFAHYYSLYTRLFLFIRLKKYQIKRLKEEFIV